MNPLAIVPMDNNVVVKPIQKGGVTEGGIVLPDGAQSADVLEYEVIAVGPGMWGETERRPIDLAVGDTVIMRSDLEIYIVPIGEGYFLTDEAQCLGKIKKGS